MNGGETACSGWRPGTQLSVGPAEARLPALAGDLAPSSLWGQLGHCWLTQALRQSAGQQIF